MSTVSWKSSIFGCCPPSIDCIKGWICPCILYGQVVEQAGYGSCMSSCLLYLICMPCCGACLIHAPTRGKMRNDYKLQESCADDRLATCCCGPCALCQERRELNERGPATGAPATQTMS